MQVAQRIAAILMVLKINVNNAMEMENFLYSIFLVTWFLIFRSKTTLEMVRFFYWARPSCISFGSNSNTQLSNSLGKVCFYSLLAALHFVVYSNKPAFPRKSSFHFAAVLLRKSDSCTCIWMFGDGWKFNSASGKDETETLLPEAANRTGGFFPNTERTGRFALE